MKAALAAPGKAPRPAKLAVQPKAADGSASAAKPAKAAVGQQQRQQRRKQSK